MQLAQALRYGVIAGVVGGVGAGIGVCRHASNPVVRAARAAQHVTLAGRDGGGVEIAFCEVAAFPKLRAGLRNAAPVRTPHASAGAWGLELHPTSTFDGKGGDYLFDPSTGTVQDVRTHVAARVGPGVAATLRTVTSPAFAIGMAKLLYCATEARHISPALSRSNNAEAGVLAAPWVAAAAPRRASDLYLYAYSPRYMIHWQLASDASAIRYDGAWLAPSTAAGRAALRRLAAHAFR